MSAAETFQARPALAELKAALSDKAEPLARKLMGPPNSATLRRPEWRWNAHGSVGFFVRDGRGKSRGLFANFETGQAGGPLDLIMHARGCGIAEAIRWAEHWLGYDRPGYVPAPPDATVLAERARKKAEQEAEAEQSEQERLDYAVRLDDETVRPDGTAGERYLIVGRKIPKPAGGWPKAIGYHPRSMALIARATTDTGDVRAVQRVYLTKAGGKISEDEVAERRLPAVKQTTGIVVGAAVRLPGNPAGPLLLCEGIETALSAWTATGRETWVALGKVGRLTPPAGRLLVICRDDDRKKKPGQPGRSNDEIHRDTVAVWRRQGLTVTEAQPWPVRRYDGSDFNDLLKGEGADAVRQRIEAAIPPDLPPEHKMPTASLAEAQAMLQGPISRLLDHAMSWNQNALALLERQRQAKRDLEEFDGEAAGRELTEAEAAEKADIQAIVGLALPIASHAGLRVALGVGKTHETAAALPSFIRRLRTAELPQIVLWTCPTLDLAAQTGGVLARLGVAVGIYRGREAPDPDGAVIAGDELSGRMCLDLASVHAALDAGENVATTVCGTDKGDGPRCPKFEQCPFQQNNKRLRHVDVVLAAHASLFHGLPEKVEKLIGLTVIDEAFWQQGLHTVELSVASLTDDVRTAPVLDSKTGTEDFHVTERLLATMREVQIVLETAPEAAPVTDFGGLDAVRCREAAKEHWRRKIEIEMYPGMPLQARKEAARLAAANRRIPRMAALMRTLADMLEGKDDAAGRLETFRDELKAGPVLKVLIHSRRPLREARLTRPILHLDGTMPVEAVRQYIPRLKVVADVQAVMPHMRTVQVLSTRDNRGGWGKNSVVPSDKLAPDEVQRRENRIGCLRDFLRGLVLRHGDGLAVSYLALESKLDGIDGLALGHFNATAGINRHERVKFAAVIGRPMPNPSTTAQMVKQLFGCWCEPEQPQERPAGLLMADGSRRTILTRRFDNPQMEGIRSAVADDNVNQAVGRPRGVRRTAACPVLVLLLTDCVTGFPLDAVTDWPTIQPDRVERMAARGVVLHSPTDAARAYPDLFPSRDAAKAALAASARSSGGSPSITIILGIPPVDRQPVRISYRPQSTPAEPKPKTRQCEVTDPARLPEMRAWLSALVGPLAVFEVHQPETPPPPAARPLRLVHSVEDLPIPAQGRAAPGKAPQRSPETMLPAVSAADFLQPIEDMLSFPPGKPDRSG